MTLARLDADGVTVPYVLDVIAELQAKFRDIYGSDAYLAPDAQDAQLLAIFGSAIHAFNQTVLERASGYAPSTAQGSLQDALAKVNELARLSDGTYSTVLLTPTADRAGVDISEALITDANGNQWRLAAGIPPSDAGFLFTGGPFLATAVQVGAINALPNTVTKPTPRVAGLAGITNAAAATPGVSPETDAALRRRQRVAVASPPRSILERIADAVAAVTGVTKSGVTENPTNAASASEIAAFAFAVVTAGGSDADVGRAILNRKPPGCYSFGSVDVDVEDAHGVTQTVQYSPAVERRLDIQVNLSPLANYNDATGDLILEVLNAYVYALPFGSVSRVKDYYGPAYLDDAAAAVLGLTARQLDEIRATFVILSIQHKFGADIGFQQADLVFKYDSQLAMYDGGIFGTGTAASAVVKR